jgi:hypothetical protein
MNITPKSLSLLFVIVLLVGATLYLFRLTTNPAGFFVDESSVAYNAYTISQSGKDEFGNSWPLFFQAFGDYKNPVYVYLLAAVFKVTGPGIYVARLLSAVSVLGAIALLGLLAARITNNRQLRPLIGLLIALSALLTPWFFELARVSFEVALFPFTVVLFLLFLQRASERESWTWTDAICLAMAAALMTYTYSVGRLLAPLLAVGVVLFATRARWPAILRFWALYLLSLLPLVNYQRTHGSALTARFQLITYIKDGVPTGTVIWQFIKHYLANLDPRRIFINGDPNIFQVIHVYRQPAMLLATFVLVMIGIWLVIRNERAKRWWWFVAYGTLVSVIPSSLTVDYFHMLRLSAFPVFLLLFAVPAMVWLWQSATPGRVVLIASILFTLIQGFVFQTRYHESRNDAWRRHLFDADYPSVIFNPALALNKTPIYLADALPTPYIQAFWYGTLQQARPGTFVRLPPDQLPPNGSVVISTEDVCNYSNALAQVLPYTLYLSNSSARQRNPLPPSGFKAGLTVATSSLTAQVGQRIEIPVVVRNLSDTLWPGCGRGASLYQLYVGSHWLDASGKWAKEEGRGSLPYDLKPGETANVKFILNAPIEPGDYVLELDLLQEGVAWFGLKGSTTTKIAIHVT